ncbi:MAG: hypothetical protein ACREEW_07260 [Caulobacteraceae bacterium]
MLQAILNGKAGAIPAGVSAGDSWRRVYRSSEDLLTATTFERLAYLDGPIVWAILVSTFRGALPPRRVAELREIEFWPLWQEASEALGQAVEPDVVLTLSLGDPPQKIVLIVECKAGNGQQYSDQWAREWLAFDAECASTDRPDELWLLALGGVADGAARTVERFTAEIRAKWGFEIRALAADWTDLARALDEIETSSSVSARIVKDLRQALDLHGYRNVQPMAGLVADVARYPISPTSASMLRAPRMTKATGAGSLHRPGFEAMRDLALQSSKYQGNFGSHGVLRPVRGGIDD